MRIDSVDLFYLAMPEITSAADGTQDTFLVRIRAENGLEGWGECDASPLVTLAAYVCPPSHGNIVGLRDLLTGEQVEGPEDISRIHRKVLRGALDIEQVHHALSGADIALWDLVGRARGEPIWKLLCDRDDGSRPCEPHGKIPYASVLFAETPEQTRACAEELRREGFNAAKFGWGPMGKHGAELDVALVEAAREGLGPDARLLVDAGVAWGTDAATALARAEAFAPFDVGWLEEPLDPQAVESYARLAARGAALPIAAGEGCSSYRAAIDLIENGRVDCIQIDAGRIGGITTAHRIRRVAQARQLRYVNHTFKSHLSLAAALHVFATRAEDDLLEFPARPSELCRDLVLDPLRPGPDGLVVPSPRPGLGVDLQIKTLQRFLRPVRVEVGGEVLFDLPAVGEV